MYHYTQLIQEPARVTSKTKSLIDHIFKKNTRKQNFDVVKT